MARSVSLYSRASDELARQAGITVALGAAEDTYGPERLIDDNPAHLFKSGNAVVGIQFAYGSKRPVRYIAIIHATFEATDDVHFLGDDDADWDHPTMDVTLTPSGWVGSGTTRWPVNTWADLSQGTGYSAMGFKYYMLACGRNVPLTQALQIGEIRLHNTLYTLERDRGETIGRDRLAIENVTAFRVSTISSRGTELADWRIGFGVLFEDERAELEAQMADVGGRVQPWLWIPDSLQAPCYLVRWAQTRQELTRQLTSVTTGSGQIAEIGRGLRPGV